MTVDAATLAVTKEQRTTGGDTNYYLQILKNSVAVECEDVIEFCDMRFAGGCAFKAVWRLCKIRQDLGKPGSTPLYEAEKDFYYTKRDKRFTVRRLANLNLFWRTVRLVRDLFSGNPFHDPDNIIIDIDDPKRLDPYSFAIGDLLEALKPTDWEAEVLRELLVLSLMRKIVGPPRKDEITRCDNAIAHALRIVDREKIFAPNK